MALSLALMTAILADKIIDTDETKQIHNELYADGIIGREEANQLFELADAADQTCIEFNELFVQAIYEHLSEDGDLSDDEIDWLVEKIGADGKVSPLEKELLREIESGLENGLPAKLQALMA